MIITLPHLRTPEIVELPSAIMQRVIDFAAIAGVRSMGLHCSLCGKDFVASNDEHAPILTMKCGCREFWSTNPKVKAH
jgi:hypothetical protein